VRTKCDKLSLNSKKKEKPITSIRIARESIEILLLLTTETILDRGELALRNKTGQRKKIYPFSHWQPSRKERKQERLPLFSFRDSRGNIPEKETYQKKSQDSERPSGYEIKKIKRRGRESGKYLASSTREQEQIGRERDEEKLRSQRRKTEPREEQRKIWSRLRRGILKKNGSGRKAKKSSKELSFIVREETPGPKRGRLHEPKKFYQPRDFSTMHRRRENNRKRRPK